MLFDDTSRLGRKVTDVLLTVERLIVRKIHCYFVGQSLDSRQKEQFGLMLPFLASIDQSQIERLRKKVEAGHRGRFDAGFHIGSIPYGYKGVRIADPESLGNTGQGASLGTKLVIVPDEAAVVIRIFQDFCSGMSMMAISRKLNAEGVHWPVDGNRTARSAEGWTPETIKRILHNERYAGRDFHKKTRVVRDERGKVTKEVREAHERFWRVAPELRIVTPELWTAAESRLKGYADRNAARYKGGYSRAQDSVNPLSGCLLCGLCGRALTLGGVQGRSTYGCPSYRNRFDCTNHLRIRCDSVTRQVSNAISKMLLAPEIFDDLIPRVYEHLKAEWEIVRRDVDVLRGLEEDRKKVVQFINNGNSYIKRGQATDSMIERLRENEGNKIRLDSAISALQAAAKEEPTLVNLRSAVKQTVSKLLMAFQAEPQQARDVLQHHIRLKFYPSEADGAATFAAIGAIHMVEVIPTEPKDVALLEGLGTPTSQQDDPSVLFFYMELDPKIKEISPVPEALITLLTEKPELSQEWMIAQTWANLIRPYVRSSWTKSVGSGAIGRAFSRHREQLEAHLILERRMVGVSPFWKVSLRDPSTPPCVSSEAPPTN